MSGFSRSDRSFTGLPNFTNRRDRDCTEVSLIRRKRDSDAAGEIRGRNALRPIFLRTATVEKASGSALLEAGRSKVMCAVYGPRPDSRAAHFNDTGRIHCNVRFAPFCGISPSVTEKLEVNLTLQYSLTVIDYWPSLARRKIFPHWSVRHWKQRCFLADILNLSSRYFF